MVVPIYYGVARMGLDLADYMGHLKEIEDPLKDIAFTGWGKKKETKYI